MKKGRKLTKASLAKIVREFDLPRKVNEFLESLGPLAVRAPEGISRFDDNGPDYNTPARFRDWVVLTKRGMLGVTAYDDWIACIFDEYEKSPAAYGGFSNGKWNHHSFAQSGHWTDREAVKDALAETLEFFQTQIRRMTK